MKKQGKSIIDFAGIDLSNLEYLANKNNRNKSKEGLIKLAIEISDSFINHLDQESFEQVTNLKK